MLKPPHNCTHLTHTSKVMLKILQERLQQDENYQIFKLDLEKAEESEIKLPASVGWEKSKRIPEKNIYFCFINYAKSLYYVD